MVLVPGERMTGIVAPSESPRGKKRSEEHRGRAGLFRGSEAHNTAGDTWKK